MGYSMSMVRLSICMFGDGTADELIQKSKTAEKIDHENN